MRSALLAPPLLLLALVGAGCSDDASGTDDPSHVEVPEVGAGFTFGDFTVADGWSMRTVTRSAGMEEVTSAEIRGEVTNDGEEPAYALFAMVFAADGEPVATINCSSPEVPPGESQELLCPGIGEPAPEDHDQIVVQEIAR